MNNKTVVTAVLTCFNRREKTLSSLEQLKQQQLPESTELRFVLVDDGSNDGTADAVRSRWPDIKVLFGDGSLYWNGGMRLAMEHAAAENPDFLWWVNDDTDLNIDALSVLLETFKEVWQSTGQKPNVVGSVADPVTGELTYGGLIKTNPYLIPLRLRLVEPTDKPQKVDVFNGNCVLFPIETYRTIGNLHPKLVHFVGDNEYSLRSVKAGIPNWLAPGYLGTCTMNSDTGTWLEPGISLRERYRRMLSIKGIPPGQRLIYYKDMGGPLWFLYYPLVYLRPLFITLREKLSIFSRIS